MRINTIITELNDLLVRLSSTREELVKANQKWPSHRLGNAQREIEATLMELLRFSENRTEVVASE